MSEPYSPRAEARGFRSSFASGSGQSPPSDANPSARRDLLGSSSSQLDVPPSGYEPGPGAPPSMEQDVKHPAAGQSAQMERIAQTKAALEDVKGVMAHNIQAIQERGERLEDLQTKTDQLAIAGHQFQSQARQVHRRMWWKNMRWWFFLAAFVLLLFGGSVFGAIRGKDHWEQQPQQQTGQPIQAMPTGMNPGPHLDNGGIV